ncbi:zonular occludens toxin domain-containing protein [Burkholderia cepacia]|uniref:zonular occludens toxin domain-containing protein n=1 Tax=Burkholderia cepacia TaxID=292 RepID=UPI001CF46482|nr:zonular occludens toxin domain-containing protein [Burkholderia cepacia]MCA8078984.1 Zonular occludens toxin [Burkholderia cepacia]
MSINAYCGIMGSGKSYEVVSGPLLEAISRGRRVVTNIDGIKEDAVHAYLAGTRQIDPTKLGRIVHVTTERVREDGFFPVEVESSLGSTVTPGLVEPGDLVAIDEGWKLWAFGEKMTAEHVAFFRMHRHFVHPITKLSCDVVIMVQSIGDLHRMLRPVIELSFVMHKLKSLGRPNQYRVEQYDGWKQNAKTRVATYYRSYKAEIFPLYKSYAGGTGQEAVVDRRQNLFSGRKIGTFAALVLFLLLGGGWLLFRYFTHQPNAKMASSTSTITSQTSSIATVGTAGMPAPNAAPSTKSNDVSDTWRVLGRFESDQTQYVVLADSSGRMRVDSPAAFNGLGSATVGRVDGERVSMWSGAKALSSPSLLSGSISK